MIPLRSKATLVVLPLGACAAWVLRDLGWPALPLGFGFTWGMGALGLHLHRAWTDPERLSAIRMAWHRGADPETTLARLETLSHAGGELGARVCELRAQCHFAQGARETAWREGWEAQIHRLSPWARPRLRRFLHQSQQCQDLRQQAEGLLEVYPRLARLRHLVGMLLLKDLASPQGWTHLQTALDMDPDDALLAEDILLTALHALQVQRQTDAPPPSPDPAWDTFHAALDALLHRHGSPQLPWNRLAPAQYALEEGLHEEVLALAHTLPPAQRPAPLWAMEIRALRELGDSEGAMEASQEALDVLPRAFEVWMERHHCALQLQRHDEALRALNEALACIPEAPEALAFWQLRRAEFAYWVEARPEVAMGLIRQVPAEMQEGSVPPLETELKVALGQFDEAYAEVETLLKAHPGDLTLLMMQADCMAGMGAWEALPAFLEALEPAARDKADYWHLLGLAHCHLGRKLPSREALERAAMMDPDNAQMILDAGHACMDLAEWDRAAHHWRQALRLEPENEEALVELAETRRLAHDPDGARRILRECLLHHPDSERAQQYLAELEAQ